MAANSKWVSSGNDGELWAVDTNNNVQRREGITKILPIGNRWSGIGPKVSQLAAFNGQVWGLNDVEDNQPNVGTMTFTGT